MQSTLRKAQFGRFGVILFPSLSVKRPECQYGGEDRGEQGSDPCLYYQQVV